MSSPALPDDQIYIFRLVFVFFYNWHHQWKMYHYLQRAGVQASTRQGQTFSPEYLTILSKLTFYTKGLVGKQSRNFKALWATNCSNDTNVSSFLNATWGFLSDASKLRKLYEILYLKHFKCREYSYMKPELINPSSSCFWPSFLPEIFFILSAPLWQAVRVPKEKQQFLKIQMKNWLNITLSQIYSLWTGKAKTFQGTWAEV